MRIEVIAPHGFCGGVDRAVRMAHELLDSALRKKLFPLVYDRLAKEMEAAEHG